MPKVKKPKVKTKKKQYGNVMYGPGVGSSSRKKK